MKMGGFVKQSLMDYPGKMAAVIFTQGCNFRCGYCHNPQLVLPELFQSSPDFDTDKIFEYLKNRKSWLDGVVITGGEPTIHNDLPDFMKMIKGLGYSIKLDTNGSNPEMLESIIHQNLADYIAMDIKTIPETKEYGKIIGINNIDSMMDKVRKSINILKNTKIEVEFRTTALPGIHTTEILDIICQQLNINHYNINPFRNESTISSYQNCTV